MDIADPAAAYERLKIETAGMLRLDVGSSSLLENLQVDLVALLRLEIDTLQGAVLAGDSVDLGRLASALTMLRSLLPAQALVSAPPPVETRFGPDHKAKLRRLIEHTLMADDVAEAEAERLADVCAREEQAAVAAATHVEAAKAAPAPSAPASPSQPPPSQQPAGAVSNQPPPPRRNDGIPAHYLKGPDEPWRPFVNEDGVIATSPWRR